MEVKSEIRNPKSETNPKFQCPKFQTPKFRSLAIWSLVLIWNLVLGAWNLGYVFAEDVKKIEPIVVNGDRVEFITESKDFTASGSVEVLYKGMRLTCDKLVLNTETKNAVAEGHARLEEKLGVMEGSKLVYNFNAKTGTVFDSNFRSNPYFSKGETMEKVSDDEFVLRRGYLTTCSYDNPHYRIKSRKMTIFPGDKVETRDSVFYMNKVPLLCVPRYTHSLRDPMAHVQLMPGKTKDWGPYMLTAWKYDITEDVRGRIYADWRTWMGLAEGLGVNYKTQDLGKGDYKFYYTQERDYKRQRDNELYWKFERFMIRWRHKWEPDPNTNAVIQYYKITDAKMEALGSQYNFLKDYFYREYEKDSLPLSYVTAHHSFDYASVDLLLQKRVNRWYSQAEMLPQINFNLPSFQLGNSQFYFNDASSYENYNYKNAAPSDRSNDTTYNKYYTSNGFSWTTKVGFINFTPSASAQVTLYDKEDVYGSTLHNSYSYGADMSTKFYRIFDIKTNLLRLDINGLRHVITPTVNYNYTNTVITPAGHFKFGGDAATGSQAAAISLENKLQTKRAGTAVDLAMFLISTTYNIKPKTGDKRGSNLSDFWFDLELRPYSWLSITSDATLKHSGNRSDTGYNHFSNVNYDIDFNFTKDRSVGIGQRYQRKGGNELTYSLKWRLNPKWVFSAYQRYNRGHDPSLKRGLREQEYVISRNFHCWDVDFTYNVRRGSGESVWLVFRLKAFPELEFEYNQAYHQPKPGSQSER
jgi:hypothetical protein